MTLYDRSQATEHIQFKSFSSMKSCGRQMRHRTKQDRRTKLSLKNVVLIIQTHDTTLTIRIAGLIKKKSTTLTVLVTGTNRQKINLKIKAILRVKIKVRSF